MLELDNQVISSQSTSVVDAEAIGYLRQAIMSGKHWYTALLEAIGIWTASEEILDGRVYRYLIAGEAFDWLLLAERLCQTVDCLLPRDEMIALLFHGQSPLELTREEFRGLIGSGKYSQCLNYFYGVSVEEALFLAVQDELCKEWRTSGLNKGLDCTAEVYSRIYGTTGLLKDFRREKGYSQLRSMSLTELKEFTYWLFKYRLKHCDKSKVASDTQKALNWLNSNSTSSRLNRHNFKPDDL